MEFILAELTKYMILAFSALFALTGGLTFVCKTKKAKKWCYICQKIDIFVMQLMCYGAIYFQTKSLKYVLLYGIAQIMLFSILLITPIIYEKVNPLLLNHMCFLLGTGFVMISRFSFFKAARQLIIAGIGFLIALIIPALMKRVKIIQKGWLFYSLFGAGLLAGVYILGEITHGSKISISVLGVTFQPSEFVKIIFVFFIASLLFEKVTPLRLIFSAIVAGTYILILAASKDLGAALIFGITYLLMVFIAANSYILLIFGMICGTAGAIAVYRLFPHIQYRVIAWRNPFEYIDGSGYQITQSLFAISSGGLFGVGLFKGNPSAIPYVEDDMIFSAICEEMGILFGLSLIVICCLSFFAIMQIGIKTTNQFHKLVCTGLAVAYASQTILTIGGGVNFIPLTGVTLPFISYGGSSVMATIFVFFIIQGIAMQSQKTPQKQKEKSYGT